MAVYTEVSDDELAAFIAEYDIGPALSCKGIAEGVENTNYLLLTEGGPCILTLYEKRVDAKDLPFFLGLIEHLAARGVPCPVPVHGRDGAVLRDALRTPGSDHELPRRRLAEAPAARPLRGAGRGARADASRGPRLRPAPRQRALGRELAAALREVPRRRRRRGARPLGRGRGDARPHRGGSGRAICRAAWSTPISSPTTSSSTARSSAA